MTEPTSVSNWNVPNVLTAIRMVLVPVFAYVLLAFPDDPGMRWLATGIFVVAIATDALDGRIALANATRETGAAGLDARAWRLPWVV